MNNFRHGLTGHRFFFIEEEQPELYDKLIAELKKEYNPQTETEELLVETMAQSRWLSQRANSLQSALWGEDYRTLDALTEHLSRLARYQAQHLRAFNQALNQLLKLREARRKEQIGFESAKAAEAEKTQHEQRQQTLATHDSLKTSILRNRLDREKSNAVVAGMKAGAAMQRELGPEGAKMMAAMMEKEAA